jgi:hypothetical protein
MLLLKLEVLPKMLKRLLLRPLLRLPKDLLPDLPKDLSKDLLPELLKGLLKLPGLPHKLPPRLLQKPLTYVKLKYFRVFKI